MLSCGLICKRRLSAQNWWFRTMVLEKTLESPLDSKAIKPVSPKGNQPWLFIGRTVAEAEVQNVLKHTILWPPDAKSRLTGKDSDAGKDWRRGGWQRKRWLDSITDSVDMNLSKLWETVEDEETGMLCSPWGRKKSEMIQRLNKKLIHSWNRKYIIGNWQT